MDYRPVWAEINLDYIAENVAALSRQAHPAELMAVVKANAYGHGAEAVARVALASGAKRLAVAMPEEGRELRRAGIAAPILVMGALLPGQVEAFLEYRLTATLASEEVLPELSSMAVRKGQPVRVHVKVDTGMSRLGFLPSQIPSLVGLLRRTPGIELEGLYTHLACADEIDLASTQAQLRGFREALAACEAVGWRPRQIHVANTAAVLREIGLAECNLVRAGIGIYGIYPVDPSLTAVQLRPAMSVKTHVATIKRVPSGTGVSYGHIYHTSRETTLCTLPIGYADGLSRMLSGQANAIIGGRKYPIVGRICMDQCVVDVGDDPVTVGDEAVLLGQQGDEQVLVEEWSDRLGTIPYEVVCGISSRVPRVYRGGIL